MIPLRSLLALWVLAACAHAQGSPGANRPDEPRLERFSLGRAVDFTDVIAPAWSARYDCVTCHTNGLYLLSRAWVGTQSEVLEDTREFARDYLRRFIEEGEQPSGRRGQVEGLVATAALLAISEARSEAGLSQTSERALLHAFELQDEQGHWPAWLKCGWPPFEVDDHFGASLVAIAASLGSDEFRAREPVRAGMTRLRAYFSSHPPEHPHQRGMLLWAARSLPDLLSSDERDAWVQELSELQREDGGWSLAELGGGLWQRADGTPLDEQSDAYATAFSVFVLRCADVEVQDPGLERGVAWLKAEQRESGRWFARSPHHDGKHYISHAATHFAIMALSECGERP